MPEQLPMPFWEDEELQAAYRRCHGLARVMTFEQAKNDETIGRLLRMMARAGRRKRGDRR